MTNQDPKDPRRKSARVLLKDLFSKAGKEVDESKYDEAIEYYGGDYKAMTSDLMKKLFPDKYSEEVVNKALDYYGVSMDEDPKQQAATSQPQQQPTSDTQQPTTEEPTTIKTPYRKYQGGIDYSQEEGLHLNEGEIDPVDQGRWKKLEEFRRDAMSRSTPYTTQEYHQIRQLEDYFINKYATADPDSKAVRDLMSYFPGVNTGDAFRVIPKEDNDKYYSSGEYLKEEVYGVPPTYKNEDPRYDPSFVEGNERATAQVMEIEEDRLRKMKAKFNEIAEDPDNANLSEDEILDKFKESIKKPKQDFSPEVIEREPMGDVTEAFLDNITSIIPSASQALVSTGIGLDYATSSDRENMDMVENRFNSNEERRRLMELARKKDTVVTELSDPQYWVKGLSGALPTVSSAIATGGLTGLVSAGAMGAASGKASYMEDVYSRHIANQRNKVKSGEIDSVDLNKAYEAARENSNWMSLIDGVASGFGVGTNALGKTAFSLALKRFGSKAVATSIAIPTDVAVDAMITAYLSKEKNEMLMDNPDLAMPQDDKEKAIFAETMMAIIMSTGMNARDGGRYGFTKEEVSATITKAKEDINKRIEAKRASEKISTGDEALDSSIDEAIPNKPIDEKTKEVAREEEIASEVKEVSEESKAPSEEDLAIERYAEERAIAGINGKKSSEWKSFQKERNEAKKQLREEGNESPTEIDIAMKLYGEQSKESKPSQEAEPTNEGAEFVRQMERDFKRAQGLEVEEDGAEFVQRMKDEYESILKRDAEDFLKKRFEMDRDLIDKESEVESQSKEAIDKIEQERKELLSLEDRLLDAEIKLEEARAKRIKASEKEKVIVDDYKSDMNDGTKKGNKSDEYKTFDRLRREAKKELKKQGISKPSEIELAKQYAKQKEKALPEIEAKQEAKLAKDIELEEKAKAQEEANIIKQLEEEEALLRQEEEDIIKQLEQEEFIDQYTKDGVESEELKAKVEEEYWNRVDEIASARREINKSRRGLIEKKRKEDRDAKRATEEAKAKEEVGPTKVEEPTKPKQQEEVKSREEKLQRAADMLGSMSGRKKNETTQEKPAPRKRGRKKLSDEDKLNTQLSKIVDDEGNLKVDDLDKMDRKQLNEAYRIINRFKQDKEGKSRSDLSSLSDKTKKRLQAALDYRSKSTTKNKSTSQKGKSRLVVDEQEIKNANEKIDNYFNTTQKSKAEQYVNNRIKALEQDGRAKEAKELKDRLEAKKGEYKQSKIDEEVGAIEAKLNTHIGKIRSKKVGSKGASTAARAMKNFFSNKLEDIEDTEVKNRVERELKSLLKVADEAIEKTDKAQKEKDAAKKLDEKKRAERAEKSKSIASEKEMAERIVSEAKTEAKAKTSAKRIISEELSEAQKKLNEKKKSVSNKKTSDKNTQEAILDEVSTNQSKVTSDLDKFAREKLNKDMTSLLKDISSISGVRKFIEDVVIPSSVSRELKKKLVNQALDLHSRMDYARKSMDDPKKYPEGKEDAYVKQNKKDVLDLIKLENTGSLVKAEAAMKALQKAYDAIESLTSFKSKDKDGKEFEKQVKSISDLVDSIGKNDVPAAIYKKVLDSLNSKLNAATQKYDKAKSLPDKVKAAIQAKEALIKLNIFNNKRGYDADDPEFKMFEDAEFSVRKIEGELVSELFNSKPKTLSDFKKNMALAEEYLKYVDIDSKRNSATKDQAKTVIEVARRNGSLSKDEAKVFSDIIDRLRPENVSKLFISGYAHNSFSLRDNLITIKDPDKFLHEIGHFGFFNVLTAKDRVEFYQHVMKKFYKNGKLNQEALDKEFSSSQKEDTPDVTESFAEYFAEKFNEYQTSRMPEGDQKTLFERFANKINKVVKEVIRSFTGGGKRVDDELKPMFDRIMKPYEEGDLSKGKSTDMDRYKVDESERLINKKKLDDQDRALAKEAGISDDLMGFLEGGMDFLAKTNRDPVSRDKQLQNIAKSLKESGVRDEDSLDRIITALSNRGLKITDSEKDTIKKKITKLWEAQDATDAFKAANKKREQEKEDLIQEILTFKGKTRGKEETFVDRKKGTIKSSIEDTYLNYIADMAAVLRIVSPKSAEKVIRRLVEADYKKDEIKEGFDKEIVKVYDEVYGKGVDPKMDEVIYEGDRPVAAFKDGDSYVVSKVKTGFKATRDYAIMEYMQWRTLDERARMERTGYTQKWLDDNYFSKLSDKDKLLADKLLEIYDKRYNEIKPVHERTTGQVLDKIKGYSKIVQDPEAFNSKEDYEKFMKMEQDILEASPIKSLVMDRTYAGYHVPKPDSGAMRNITRYSEEYSNYVAKVDAIKEMTSTYRSDLAQKIIGANHGRSYNKAIEEHLKVFADKNPSADTSPIVATFRKMLIFKYLGLNHISATKQLASSTLHSMRVSSKDFFSEVINSMMNPRRTMKELKEIFNEPVIQRRIKSTQRLYNNDNLVNDFNQLRLAYGGANGLKKMQMAIKNGNYGYLFDKMISGSLVLTKGMDMVAVMMGLPMYKARLKEGLAKGMDQAEAKKYALEEFTIAIEELQQPTSNVFKSLPNKKRNDIVRMSTMFLTSPQAMVNRSVETLLSASQGRTSKKQAVKNAFYTSVLAPAAFTVLGMTGNDLLSLNDKKWWKDNWHKVVATMTPIINAVPIFSQTYSRGLYGGYETAAIRDLINDMVSGDWDKILEQLSKAPVPSNVNKVIEENFGGGKSSGRKTRKRRI